MKARMFILLFITFMLGSCEHSEETISREDSLVQKKWFHTYDIVDENHNQIPDDNNFQPFYTTLEFHANNSAEIITDSASYDGCWEFDHQEEPFYHENYLHIVVSLNPGVFRDIGNFVYLLDDDNLIFIISHPDATIFSCYNHND
jgi:hypothetical protein